MFPFPNDYFTKRDKSTPTGRRLNLSRTSLPSNITGTRIDATEFNRGDGFSPNQQIVLKVPGLETKAAFDRTGLVPLTDLGRTYARHQPVVLIDTRTRKRQLIWAELDAGATSPASTALLIHPATNLAGGATVRGRAAQPENRDGPDDPGAAGVPRLPRRPAHRLTGGRGAPAGDEVDLQDAAKGGHPA